MRPGRRHICDNLIRMHETQQGRLGAPVDSPH